MSRVFCWLGLHLWRRLEYTRYCRRCERLQLLVWGVTGASKITGELYRGWRWE